MCKNTFEEYKKAIKAKYEIEKTGEYAKYLSSPTQANLRKLCWERFRENNNTADLKAFQNFFDFEFSIHKKNQLKEQTDKLKPIGAFILGKTESPTDETIEFAAVLVDFKLKPYRNFEKNGIREEKSIDNSADPELVDEVVEKETESFSETKKASLLSEKVEEDSQSKKSVWKTKYFEKLFNRSKPAMISTAVIFCLIAVTIYFAFIKKNCMQWSEDHFDIVDCNSNILKNQNKIIPYDENLLDFRKLRVCDTTTNYSNMWYSKKDNVVEFFNTHGRNPVNDKALRAVTQGIFDKYAEKCGSKK
ncbi:hypothetical protein [Flavobacterium sp. 245]|uniref:hypothetical protein n=1 Tax=Flavobacterium sp. 245 TaxID=2512115 RepID=UPI00105F0CEA|nr:hypothetical protein [Flavobacterium sp. 245]TDP02269.1 hypothetical protein EV145_103251 [Flavobacterium sp. 245]